MVLRQYRRMLMGMPVLRLPMGVGVDVDQVGLLEHRLIAEENWRRSGRENRLALIQDVELFGDQWHNLQVVGGRDDRFAHGLELYHEIDQFPPASGIERGRRFIHQKDVRVARQHRGNGEPLLFPTTQLLWRAIAQPFDPQQTQEVLNPLLHCSLWQAELERPKRNLLPDRGGEKLRVGILEHQADFGPKEAVELRIAQRCIGERLAQEPDLPLLGNEQSSQELEESGLPRAIGPEAGESLSGSNLKRHIRESGMDSLIRKTDVREFKDARLHTGISIVDSTT